MITPEKAELLGAHIGDGTLYQTKWSLVWELRGSLYEKEYYVDPICPLIFEIFGLNVISKFRSGGAHGAWGVQTTNKQIINFFLENGMKAGTKTYTVSVPQFILEGDVNVKRALVKGLFDTDGCLRFDRLNDYKEHSYPRIEFSSASVKLRDSLNFLFQSLGFRTHIWNDRKAYCLGIAGKAMLKKWIFEIQPKNPKHLKKYDFWEEKGHYIPSMKHAIDATVA